MKTIRIIFLLAFLFTIFPKSFSQSFEGTLIYTVDIQVLGDSMFNGINKKEIITALVDRGEMPKDTITYFYSKTGDYVSLMNLKNVNYINTYLRKKHLLYSFTGNINIVTAIDVTIDLEEKLGHKPSVALLEKKEKIGDFECSVVEVKWNSGVYRYFFSEGILNVDPELYKDYQYDQWYNYLKISKALPIRIEKEMSNLCLVSYNLYFYNEDRIDKELFDIPKMKEDKDLSKIYPNKKVFIIED